eukprot:scaffold4273_cov215-Pinguiococcus_pyrenoidosus.AAC.2
MSPPPPAQALPRRRRLIDGSTRAWNPRTVAISRCITREKSHLASPRQLGSVDELRFCPDTNPEP